MCSRGASSAGAWRVRCARNWFWTHWSKRCGRALQPRVSCITVTEVASQYLSIRYCERLAEAKAQPSVGSVGDSYDNALAETIIGLYKTEVIHRRGPWRHLEAVEYATLEWVDWFNHRRLLEPIGNVPPAEFEASYYHSTNQLPMAV
jgi:putative transposase